MAEPFLLLDHLGVAVFALTGAFPVGFSLRAGAITRRWTLPGFRG
jgi:hypothetical protein